MSSGASFLGTVALHNHCTVVTLMFSPRKLQTTAQRSFSSDLHPPPGLEPQVRTSTAYIFPF